MLPDFRAEKKFRDFCNLCSKYYNPYRLVWSLINNSPLPYSRFFFHLILYKQELFSHFFAFSSFVVRCRFAPPWGHSWCFHQKQESDVSKQKLFSHIQLTTWKSFFSLIQRYHCFSCFHKLMLLIFAVYFFFLPSIFKYVHVLSKEQKPPTRDHIWSRASCSASQSSLPLLWSSFL